MIECSLLKKVGIPLAVLFGEHFSAYHRPNVGMGYSRKFGWTKATQITEFVTFPTVKYDGLVNRTPKKLCGSEKVTAIEAILRARAQ